ncbi:GGDEF domain-containing protein [Desulfogranum japonicum]|uniref:GGDEF domain-containing protein n=1 Tax=Desulfogranum japonicum TaxID=231447 RepID=UPI0003F70603|nr:bifunctional diguanylate cyclase/phosphodiesterase [Desulfogranum japonicum]
MSRSLQKELAEIIEHQQITVTFQPIVHLQQRNIYGYEGLIRGPVGTLFHSPTRLFEIAQHSGMLSDIYNLTRQLVFEQFSNMLLPGFLFLNTHPATILNRESEKKTTLDAAREAGLDPSRIIIELTATYPIDDVMLIRQTMEHYRRSGFAIALDDLGDGYSQALLWSETRPDIVKIDRDVIAGIDEDRQKQRFISTVLKHTHDLGIRVIIEGVEGLEEYKTIRKIGAEMAQGYYFCRPARVPPKSIAPKIFRRDRRTAGSFEKMTIEELAKPAFPVQATVNVYSVGDIFTGAPELESVVILQNNDVLGMVLRSDFMNIYASMYGKDLYGKQPIAKFINRNTLQVEKHLPLEEVSYRLTTALNTYTDEFIILDNGKLLGKGKLIDLLHEITKLRIIQARYANPLTLLPGNVPIQEHLQYISNKNEPYVVCYFDLDNFKPFNDFFGFARGDKVIRFVSDLLVSNSDEKIDFVGHVGGDDFILIFRSVDWRSKVENILTLFDKSISSYYEGHQGDTLDACDRNGKRQQYAIMSLSVGAVVVPQSLDYYSIDLPGEASLAKHEAKKKAGSSMHIRYLKAPTGIEKEL